MAKNTSILLGSHYQEFINQQIQSGRYSSASEVVRAALRIFEESEAKKTALLKALEEGEKSGYIKDFDGEKFLANLHDKYLTK